MDRVTDAVECFHQMTSELEGEVNQQGDHSEWALGEGYRIPRRRRRLHNVFCQNSGSVSSTNWSILET